MRAAVAKGFLVMWRKVAVGPQRLSPLFWLALVVICLLAVLSGYQVSFSIHEGFRFEPAAPQVTEQRFYRAFRATGVPLTPRYQAGYDRGFMADHIAHHAWLLKA
jgi:hypothetical protein